MQQICKQQQGTLCIFNDNNKTALQTIGADLKKKQR